MGLSLPKVLLMIFLVYFSYPFTGISFIPTVSSYLCTNDFQILYAQGRPFSWLQDPHFHLLTGPLRKYLKLSISQVGYSVFPTEPTLNS